MHLLRYSERNCLKIVEKRLIYFRLNLLLIHWSSVDSAENWTLRKQPDIDIVNRVKRDHAFETKLPRFRKMNLGHVLPYAAIIFALQNLALRVTRVHSGGRNGFQDAFIAGDENEIESALVKLCFCWLYKFFIDFINFFNVPYGCCVTNKLNTKDIKDI